MLEQFGWHFIQVVKHTRVGYPIGINNRVFSIRYIVFCCTIISIDNNLDRVTDIVKFLVENGANVNAKAANGNTPLSLAEEEEDQEIIELLKQLGAK